MADYANRRAEREGDGYRRLRLPAESPGSSRSCADDGTVYHTYSTRGGGEFLMGYYPILDRAPKGRDEGEAMHLWIRRHDEYEGE